MKCDRLSCSSPATWRVVVKWTDRSVSDETLCSDHADALCHAAVYPAHKREPANGYVRSPLHHPDRPILELAAEHANERGRRGHVAREVLDAYESGRPLSADDY